MKLGVLLTLVVTLVQRSTTTVKLSCDPVELGSPEPRCWPLASPDGCVGVVGQRESSNPDCYTEPNACPASELNYSKVIVASNGAYSITGFPNFTEDSWHIGYCPQPPNSAWDTGGCLPFDNNAEDYHVEDVRIISYTPVDSLHYNITVGWRYPAPYPIPEGSVFRLLVKTPGARVGHEYCVCINGTLRLTEHSLTVEYNPGDERNYVEAAVVTFPLRAGRDTPPAIGGSYAATPPLLQFPVNCSEGLPYSRSRCAIPYHGKPRNLKMNVVGTVTRVSWEKPCYKDPNACRLLEIDPSVSQSDPVTYYLSATVHNITHYFIVHNTTAVVLHTTNLEDFKLYTQTPCSGACEDDHFANGCSEPATLNDSNSDTCCEPEPTSVTTVPSVTSTPTKPESTTVEPVAGPSHLIAAVVVILVAGVGIIALVVVLGYCRYKTKTHVDMEIHPSPWPSHYPFSGSPSPIGSESTLVPSVLVVFSPRTNHKEKQVILQCLIANLADCNIVASAYGTSQLRESPTEWVVEQWRRANAVLCVCNREFFQDWSDDAMPYFDHTPKVVRTLKQLFEGDLQEGSVGVRPYAVIRMSSSDGEFIPPLLKSRPNFMYYQTKDIAHFVHDKPMYQ